MIFASARLVAQQQPGSAATDRYPHATEPIGTVRQIYDGALTPELAVHTFRNIDRLFPTRPPAETARSRARGSTDSSCT